MGTLNNINFEKQKFSASAKKIATVLMGVGIFLFLLFTVLSFFSSYEGGHEGGSHGGHHLLRPMFAYLFSYAFYMSLFLGCLFFVILHYLTAARWSSVVRRIPEVFLKSILLLAGLILPILFFSHSIFHWLDQKAVAEDPILKGKEPYLNFVFFLVRSFFYFAIWLYLGHRYYKKSILQDKNGDAGITLQLRKFSAPHMFLFAISVTFFAFDYLMSLDPHWFSTIWGVYYFAGAMVITFCFIPLVLIILQRLGYLKNIITIEHFHALGKLLFAFNVFWAYIAFSQYLLIWYANIPEDTVFFLRRTKESGWLNFSFLLLIGHIFVPILFFISRNFKRNIKAQLIMIFWCIFIHFVDMYWVVMPNVDSHFHFQWTDLVIFFGFSFLFIGFFIFNLSKVSLVAHKDPLIEKSISFEN